jgi:hypothetical protein
MTKVCDFNHKKPFGPCAISPVPVWEKAHFDQRLALWKIATIPTVCANFFCSK